MPGTYRCARATVSSFTTIHPPPRERPWGRFRSSQRTTRDRPPGRRQLRPADIRCQPARHPCFPKGRTNAQDNPGRSGPSSSGCIRDHWCRDGDHEHQDRALLAHRQLDQRITRLQRDRQRRVHRRRNGHRWARKGGEGIAGSGKATKDLTFVEGAVKGKCAGNFAAVQGIITLSGPVSLP
jgi:hypothetical protein